MKTDQTLSRRHLLASVPALAATAGPAAATALSGLPGGDDAELLALGRELDDCQAEFDRAETLPAVEGEEAMTDATEWAHDVIDEIYGARPATMAGLAVIALAVQAEIRWWHTEIDGSILVDEIKPAKALADAVLALAGAAS